jgi:hypothetical protein
MIYFFFLSSGDDILFIRLELGFALLGSYQSFPFEVVIAETSFGSVMRKIGRG